MPLNPSLTPQSIVDVLNKYIVGQQAAKKAFAVALRNRERRRYVDPALRDEILPSNILLRGSTGTGKTELARRVAKGYSLPFIKVEATQYTERGYVGDDVKNMIQQLADLSLELVKKAERKKIEEEVGAHVELIIIDALAPPVLAEEEEESEEGEEEEETDRPKIKNEAVRTFFRKELAKGNLEDREIEIPGHTAQMPGGISLISNNTIDENMISSLNNLMSRFLPRGDKRRLPISEARKVLFKEELEQRLDKPALCEKACRKAEYGIIFIDEIDKIANRGGKVYGIDVSREGVQRNLLPLVEGTTVNTKIGPVKTDHILFIAAGAFHSSQPSDLMPELRGRFPVQVTLQDLTEEDYAAILRLPDHSLLTQRSALIATENVNLTFTEGGIQALAKATAHLNETQGNIGARRLRFVVEHVVEEIFFETPEIIKPSTTVTIDKKMVNTRLNRLLQKQKSSYIL